MSVSFHFLNGTTYGPHSDNGPGTIIVDPLANIDGGGATSALALAGGPWTLRINGRVTADDGFAISLYSGGGFVSNITVGADAEILAAGNAAAGISSAHRTNITNAGHVKGELSGITLYGNGKSAVTNLKAGAIEGDSFGISIPFSGLHVIANAGTVSGQFAIFTGYGVDQVTNWGLIQGNVNLGENSDSFTNFKTVGAIVKHGIVTGIIDLGAGDDTFTGGRLAEKLKDAAGKDTIALGGGADRWLGYLGGSGDLTDRIDGGAGTDAYDASLAGVIGVLINLDATAHRDPLGNRQLAAQTANDIGNAATAADKIIRFEEAYGSDGNDTIFGTAGANKLVGGKGDDLLVGLGGTDKLFGGEGNDVFAFVSLKDSPAAANHDVISVFDNAGPTAGDRIDLHVINEALGFDIHFLGVGVAFDGHRGALRAVWTVNQTIVQLDANGDRKSDFAITIDGHQNLDTSDFILEL